jgi:cell division protein FtsB
MNEQIDVLQKQLEKLAMRNENFTENLANLIESGNKLMKYNVPVAKFII